MKPGLVKAKTLTLTTLLGARLLDIYLTGFFSSYSLNDLVLIIFANLWIALLHCSGLD